jgi:hypothetical protein
LSTSDVRGAYPTSDRERDTQRTKSSRASEIRAIKGMGGSGMESERERWEEWNDREMRGVGRERKWKGEKRINEGREEEI